LFGKAQKQGNVWYFGNHAGLDFNSGSPIPLTNGSTYNAGSLGSEGTAVISDSSGSVSFYTNGQQVWDKNHIVMPNGDSLLGNISTTQAALIIAQPGSSRYFYVFTVDDFYNDNLKYGFRYSIVDICLNGGSGDVIFNQKNIKMLDTVCEKITAVRHSNGTDYWIIVHKYYSDAFYAFQLSASGISNGVISNTGSVHPVGMVGVGGAIGELKASPNGKRLAIVNGQSTPNIAEYFDFDNSTGVVSNPVSVQVNPNYSYYGASFSPDNSKLYVSCWLNGNGVYQFNLAAGNGNKDSVIASGTKVNAGVHWAMQLAVDGKIYLTRSGNPNAYISEISNPDGSGMNCNFIDSAIYLNGGIASQGLPNFIDSYEYSNTSFRCVTGIEEWTKDIPLTVYPNPAENYITIGFQLPRGITSGCIVFYDIMGKEARRVSVDENSNFKLISIEDLAAGTYYYQLQTSGTSSAGKKLVVIK